MLISKKAQSQIITTVLIILLVLASIVVVWQIVQGTVRRGLEESETKAACIGVNLEIISAVASSNEVKVTRNIGGPEGTIVSNVKFLVEGVAVTSSPPTQEMSLLETHTLVLTPSFNEGDEISIAAVLSGDTEVVCDIADTYKATA
jgi:hypothetical protein